MKKLLPLALLAATTAFGTAQATPVPVNPTIYTVAIAFPETVLPGTSFSYDYNVVNNQTVVGKAVDNTSAVVFTYNYALNNQLQSVDLTGPALNDRFYAQYNGDKITALADQQGQGMTLTYDDNGNITSVSAIVKHSN